MNVRRAAQVTAVAFLLTACTSGGGRPANTEPSVAPTAAGSDGATVESASPATGGSVQLTVYGAASLKGVLGKVKAAYAQAEPDVTLTVSTDSSTALETQIEQGAPGDVFLSADTANPQKLVDKGLAIGSPVPFAENLLTIIVPAGNRARVASPADLARDGVKVIAAGDSVPITKYAKQLVTNLAKEAGYPTDFVAGYTRNVVSKEDNVAAVLAKIELGEGDAAIVYVTDASASGSVGRVEVPPDANVVATYAGVVLKASPHEAAARRFMDWFTGPGGQAILGAAGFSPPG
jgi:molybdate transport system substrate-binding protein